MASTKSNTKSKPTPSVSEDERRWRAQSDVRTLQEAEKIRSDKSRMADAKKEAKSQLDAMAQIAKAAPKEAQPKAIGKRNESMSDFVKQRESRK